MCCVLFFTIKRQTKLTSDPLLLTSSAARIYFFFAVYWVSLLFVGIALVVVLLIVVAVVVLAWSFIYNICMLLSSFVSPHSPGFARSFVWGWEFCFAIFFRAVAFSCQPSIVSSSRDENGACFFIVVLKKVWFLAKGEERALLIWRTGHAVGPMAVQL